MTSICSHSIFFIAKRYNGRVTGNGVHVWPTRKCTRPAVKRCLVEVNCGVRVSFTYLRDFTRSSYITETSTYLRNTLAKGSKTTTTTRVSLADQGWQNWEIQGNTGKYDKYDLEPWNFYAQHLDW